MAHPSKRPRSEGSHEGEEDPNGTPPPIVEDKEAWFPDGNIDIIAEYTAFRVHRDVLSAHSEVFRDMLGIPQPIGNGDRVEHPTVDVSDTAEEIRHLLLVLYYRHPQFKSNAPAEYKLVSSLARVAHKYQVKSVLDDAISRIKAYYPDNLEELRKVTERDLDNPLIHRQSTDHCDVIRLARLVGEKSLLRPAFYQACQLPSYMLLGKQTPKDDHYDASRRLSDSDLERCIAGIAYLVSARPWCLGYALNEGRPEECWTEDCERTFDSIRTVYLDDGPTIAYDHRQCATFRRIEVADWTETLCGICAREIGWREDRAHKVIWDSLPRVLNLESA